MGYQTTLGWSLLSSGITTLLLKVLPGDSLWWGVSFLIIGTLIIFIRKGAAE